MPPARWLIYGANGYTGELCAREARRRGLRPVLAGRSRDRIAPLARELGCEGRAFPLDDEAELRRGLEGVDLVLHCAGPFVRTSRPMVAACLAAGVHYLDITGEIAVFESVFRRDDAAREAGTVLLPGTGFDVVPTDCLAARLASELPDATRLELAFQAEGGSISRGTAKTMIEGLPWAGAIRRGGEIVRVPPAWDAREIDFGCGRRWAVTIPWGDLSTAFRSTGIGDIRVYSGRSPRLIRRMRRWRPLLPLLGWTPVKRLLQWWIGQRITGPGETVREHSRVYLWGSVENDSGGRVTATCDTPEAYAFTAVAAVECAVRVAAGEVDAGARTPATAFGKAFVEGLPGVTPIRIVERLEGRDNASRASRPTPDATT